MTPKQRDNLAKISQAITSGHAQVSESFAVGQVALVTGRSWDQALQGLRLMQTEKLIPPGWIKPETEGVISRLTASNRTLAELFSRFDLIPGKTETIPFCGFCKPARITPEEIRNRLTIPAF
jgi:hypothetical protein